MSKHLPLILGIGIILLFSGIVCASGPDDTNDQKNIIKIIGDLKDHFDLLDMVMKNKEDLDYLREDPTNQTRMVESV